MLVIVLRAQRSLAVRKPSGFVQPAALASLWDHRILFSWHESSVEYGS